MTDAFKTRIGRSFAAATTVIATAITGVLFFATTAGATTTTHKSVASSELSCQTFRGTDNRGHGACDGSGTWTLHITCNPGWPERATTTQQAGGHQELALGCGIAGVKDVWITKYA